MADLLQRADSSYYPAFRKVFRDTVAGSYFEFLSVFFL